MTSAESDSGSSIGRADGGDGPISMKPDSMKADEAGCETCGGNGCIDLQSDPNHCGTCSNTCDDANTSASTCSRGVCTSTCKAGFYLTGTHCVACAAIPGCTSAVTCTNGIDSQCASCDTESFLVDATTDRCATCSPKCGAGQYESQSCSTAHDRRCVTCTSLPGCSATTCTNATDAQCTACDAEHFWNGTSCAACQTCSAGTHESTTCRTEHDRACTSCTVIPNCTAETCATGAAPVCGACANGYYLKDNACVACSAACGTGSYESRACGGSVDRTCAACAAIPHCTSQTCSTGSNQICSACASGYYLSGNSCVACSGACTAGQYESVACTSAHDRTCSACTAIGHCATVTCSSSSDQICSSCASEFFLNNSTCTICRGACGAGQYQATSCAGTQNRTCLSCTPITGCGTVTCTNSSNQTCSACSAGRYASGNTCPACTPVAHCSAVTCTTSSNQTCTTCDSGYTLSAGTCLFPLSLAPTTGLMFAGRSKLTLTVTNPSSFAVDNVTATLPASMADVTVVNNCGTIAPSSSCTIVLTSKATYHPPTDITIAGDGTVTLTQSVSVASPVYATGNVLAMATDPSQQNLYVGGDFDLAYTFPGFGVLLDTTTGERSYAYPQMNEEPKAVVPDGNGGFYVGGLFTTPAPYLFHLLSTGQVDSTFTPNPDGKVTALLLDGGTLYVGGDFATIGGENRTRIASVDAATGVATTFNPGASDVISQFAKDGDTLYVAGSFTSIGGGARNHLAALDTTLDDHNATNFDPDADGDVLSIALDSVAHTLFVGGAFTHVNSTPRNYLAAMDTTQAATVRAWNPDASGTVNSILLDGSTLYVAGAFSIVNGEGKAFIAAVEAGSGHNTSFNLGADDEVYSIAKVGTELFFAGKFFAIGSGSNRGVGGAQTNGAMSSFTTKVSCDAGIVAGSNGKLFVGLKHDPKWDEVTRHRVFAVNLSTGLITGFSPDMDNFGYVSSLAATDAVVYLGGVFYPSFATHVKALVGFDAHTSAFSGFDPNMIGEVKTIALDDNGALYIGGAFTNVGSTSRNHIAAVNANGTLMTSFNPDADGDVSTIVLNGSSVYVGGAFTNIGGLGRNHIALVDATMGAAVSWDPNANGAVNTLLFTGGNTLYVGGAFSVIDATTRNNLAQVNASTGVVDSSFDPNANGAVNALLFADSTLYVGGNFSNIGTSGFSGYSALDTAGNVIRGGAAPAPVNALARHESLLFFSGSFRDPGSFIWWSQIYVTY